MTTDEMQAALDKGAAALDKMKKQAEEAANQLCREGNNEASADLRALEASLTYAMYLGRRIDIDGITAEGGGK